MHTHTHTHTHKKKKASICFKSWKDAFTAVFFFLIACVWIWALLSRNQRANISHRFTGGFAFRGCPLSIFDPPANSCFVHCCCFFSLLLASFLREWLRVLTEEMLPSFTFFFFFVICVHYQNVRSKRSANRKSKLSQLKKKKGKPK